MLIAHFVKQLYLWLKFTNQFCAMIDFTRSELTHFVIHYVGNKGLGEDLTLSDKTIQIKDDFLKDTVMRYLTDRKSVV